MVPSSDEDSVSSGSRSGSLSFFRILFLWEHSRTHGQGQSQAFGERGVCWGKCSGLVENDGYWEEDDPGKLYGDGEGTGVKYS